MLTVELGIGIGFTITSSLARELNVSRMLLYDQKNNAVLHSITAWATALLLKVPKSWFTCTASDHEDL